MNFRTRFQLIVEDESTLERVVNCKMSLLGWILSSLLFLTAIMGLGALLFILTPARTVLPGYLKDSERTAAELQLMRLDSLRDAYSINQKYLENFKTVLNPPLSNYSDSLLIYKDGPGDSLLASSEDEQRFMANFRDREKYNLAVIAPLAAERMMFSPISEEGVISDKTKRREKAEVILARDAAVLAIADGTVISVSQSIREGGGSAVIIQHPNGFLSRISRLGTVLVEAGDEVNGGQVIAVQDEGNARRNELIYIELWHNGSSLVPFDYLGDSSSIATRYPD